MPPNVYKLFIKNTIIRLQNQEITIESTSVYFTDLFYLFKCLFESGQYKAGKYVLHMESKA